MKTEKHTHIGCTKEGETHVQFDRELGIISDGYDLQRGFARDAERRKRNLVISREICSRVNFPERNLATTVIR